MIGYGGNLPTHGVTQQRSAGCGIARLTSIDGLQGADVYNKCESANTVICVITAWPILPFCDRGTFARACNVRVLKYAWNINDDLINAVNVFGDPLTVNNAPRVTGLAAEHRLPASYLFRLFATNGGLISYGPDLADLFIRAGGYVDKILKGAKPSDLPVELPTKFELVINRKTANALGLTVPPRLLALANEVIE